MKNHAQLQEEAEKLFSDLECQLIYQEGTREQWPDCWVEYFAWYCYYSHLLRPNSMTVSSNCLCLSSGLNLTLGARYSLSSRLRANITDRELTLTRMGLIFKMNRVHYFTGNNKSEYLEYVFSRLWFHDVSLIAAGARDTRAGLTLVLWLVSCGARGSGQGTGCYLGNGYQWQLVS